MAPSVRDSYPTVLRQTIRTDLFRPAGLARWRWQTIDRAMRTGRPIPQPILGNLVGAAIVLGGLATIVLVLRADAG